MKKQWSLMDTIIEEMFFCESECLYMEKLTYVQQIEIQKTKWSLTAILMKDKYLCDTKCLYVEKTTYSKKI
jgi:ethanolamine utilization protein EutP (predicted NTPase)